MVFSVQDKVQMCLIYAKEGVSFRAASEIFHQRFPDKPKPSAITFRKVFTRFCETGSVLVKKRRKRSATGDETAVGVLTNVAVEQNISTARLAANHGISKTSAWKILKTFKFHPYKMSLQHAQKEADMPKRVEFSTWALNEIEGDPEWISNVLFSDEALFYLNGRVNSQNYRYWADVNPHWMRATKAQNSPRVMVWCGIWNDRVIGPFFFPGNVTGQAYLLMLRDFIENWIDENVPLAASLRLLFQQDGASSHRARAVKDYLNAMFPGRWIGLGGPRLWPPRSPDLTPMDFYFWGFIKSLVYLDEPASIEELKVRITLAAAAVLPETLLLVRQEFSSRLEHVLAVNGNHIEHLR